MGILLTNQLGKVEISDNALAAISGSALYDCVGIVGLPSKKISDGINDFLGRENISKGIKISVEDDKISVDVSVVVEYGVNIAKAAEGIITAIKEQVNNITGFQVAKVNVHVEGIKLDK